MPQPARSDFRLPVRRRTLVLDAAMSVRTVEGSSTLEIDAAERPAIDRVAMDRARARAERALFGRADPARLGRYEILDPIASGGMGFVYAPHDPDLDRRGRAQGPAPRPPARRVRPRAADCTAYHDFHPALVVQYVDCQAASG